MHTNTHAHTLLSATVMLDLPSQCKSNTAWGCERTQVVESQIKKTQKLHITLQKHSSGNDSTIFCIIRFSCDC